MNGPSDQRNVRVRRFGVVVVAGVAHLVGVDAVDAVIGGKLVVVVCACVVREVRRVVSLERWRVSVNCIKQKE